MTDDKSVLTINLMKAYLVLVIATLFGACSSNRENDNHDTKSSNSIDIEQDSLKISQSDEFRRLVKFLDWYKLGHEKLYMPRIEKSITTDTSYYVYVDTLAAKELLYLYRESGYFTDNYIRNDSLYIERAKTAYQQKNLEVDDYFDHDFILKTQEVEGTLDAIPNIYILANHSDLDTKKIAVSIGGYMNLRFIFKDENGQPRIDQIENLGLLE